MSDVLFIKTSSLGDVIHHMPALTEARARRPNDRFAWVVEEAYAPLVRLHPAVDDVIPVATRRWRGGLNVWQPSTWSERIAFRRRLRAREYAEVIDTQGLFFKSAMIARRARGRSHGYDEQSIKEPAAARLYDVRHHVEWNQHAIARNRELTGLALGYAPQGAPDYGLDAARIAGANRRCAMACCFTPRPSRTRNGRRKTGAVSPRRSAGISSCAAVGHAGRADAGTAHRVGHRTGARAGTPAAR